MALPVVRILWEDEAPSVADTVAEVSVSGVCVCDVCVALAGFGRFYLLRKPRQLSGEVRQLRAALQEAASILLCGMSWWSMLAF